MAMRNKIAVRCRECDAPVPVGAGFSERTSRGWQTVCAKPVCFARTGWALPAPTSTARTLNAAGEIHTPYRGGAEGDAERALLRSAPGARWQKDRQCWTVSLAVEDRPRVLEIARKLDLTVDPALLPAEGLSVAASLAPAAAEAGERARAAKAYDHQVVGAEFLALRRKALLADDMGLGKTFQVLAALPREAKAVAVVPASLRLNWAAEVRRWRPDLAPVVLRKRGEWRTPATGEVVIIGFDTLPDEETIEASRAALADVTLVVDEVHRCKSYVAGYTSREGKAVKAKGAQRAKRTAALAACTARQWALTGTPLLNRPFDLRGCLAAFGAAEKAFGTFPRFVRLFQGRQDRFGGWSWGRPLPEVPELLRRVMLRRRKSEVELGLPPKIRSERLVEVSSAKLRKELDTALASWRDEWDNDAGPTRLPAFTEFSAIRAALAADRIDAMLDLVEDYEDAEKPLLVFSAHRAPVDALATREGWATITGDTSLDERQRVVEAFQAGKLRGVGLTITAGGVGLTLTRASDVLFVDRDWVPANNLQAEDRCHRIGQRAAAVNIVYLTSEHPLDQHVARLLAEKLLLIEQAVEAELKVVLPENVDADSNTAREAYAKAVREAAEKIERDAAKAAITRRHEGLVARTSEWTEKELTAEYKAQIRAGIEFLAGRCDFAETKDGAGFSKADAPLGHHLACLGWPEDDVDAWRAAERLTVIYRRQLTAAGLF